VIGIQPFVEPCIVPFSAILGHRIGIVWLMCIAAALGVIANLLFATSGSVFGMFAAQILMGGVGGVFMVLGILVAQRLVPNAVATASAIFLSSSALSSALGGVAGGIDVATLGLPSVFFIPAACSLLAVVGLTAMAKNYNFH
jgi:SET family sugar efflux transporter-like MFS transporter